MTAQATTKQKTAAQKEMDILKEQIALLTARLDDTQPQQGETTLVDSEIKTTDYIKVMSLLPFVLNLSTEGFGQGRIKKFTKFGEIKNILYSDLVDIIEAHRNFLDAGYFYILNPAVIRQLGLNDIYDAILTKEKIEEVLAADSRNAVDLYKSANEAQQEIIVSLFVEKLRDNPDTLNLNIVDMISRESGINIPLKASESRALLKALEHGDEPEEE